MRSLVPALVGLAALARAATTPIPPPEGFVTDRANLLPAETREQLTRLLEELQQKTSAEIAVVTVDSTAPLDDFTYAMRLAEAWKPGRKAEDTGIVFLVAPHDRKLRVLVGYGLESVLPDGLVGEIEDREIIPRFKAGDYPDGIVRGVTALAQRIAADRGVTLTGAPPLQATRRPERLVLSPLVVLGLLVFLLVVLYLAQRQSGFVRRRGGFFPPMGPWDSGGFGGGWSGGGGGFGGFGGGSFGGGGAGRSW
jgi:uncharacterized protein